MLLVSLDGAIGPAEDARIAVTDHGLLRGDGVFEATRLYAGRPFALDEHLDRLERSGAGLRLPIERDLLRAEIDAFLATLGPEDGVLRVLVTRGGRRIVLGELLPALPAAASVMSVTYAPNRILDGLKTFSYAANMLATRLAQEAGHDDALLVTPHGRVLEAPTACVFWARDGRLRTPPLEERILPSITRAHLIDLLDSAEESCTLDELLDADEAFLASSVREVQPVAALDGRQFGEAPGPLTEAAAQRLREHIADELARTCAS